MDQNQLSRHQIRELAFQAIFALQMQPEQSKNSLKSTLFENNKYEEYYDILVNGVSNMFTELDDRYKTFLKDKWKIDRLSNVTKAIIRIAIFEMTERIDIPQKVAIDESLELAKEYADDTEKDFINGLLGSFVKSV